MSEVQLVEDDLGHHANASPKVAQGMAEVLCSNRACDFWATWSLLLF
jgi:hypothetical protein